MRIGTGRIASVTRAVLAIKATGQTDHAGRVSRTPFAVANLLTDLMYYCRAAGIQFDEEVKIARSYYDEEQQRRAQP